MPIATGSRHGLRYAAETAMGTIPAQPALAELRHTGTSLVLSKENIVSNERRPDRQIADMRMVGNRVAGDIGFELSYGAYDELLEALFMGTWNNNVLKSGTIMRSFTVERAFTDIGQYQVFTGCLVNQMTLAVQPNAVVTGAFSLVGKGAALNAAPLDAAPTAAPAHPPLDAVSGALKEGGAVVGHVTGIELTFVNGIEPKFVIGSPDAATFTVGKSNVSGKVSVFFQDAAMIRKFIEEEASSLEITFAGPDGKGYRLLLPRILYSGSENPVEDDEAILLDMPFQALFDPTTQTNIQLTRLA